MRFLRATHHLKTSSVILHGLHSWPYTTKYTHTSTYFIIQNTFFRWFYLSETTLRYFHFLLLFFGRTRQILWISICGCFLLSLFCVVVVDALVPLQFEYVCLVLTVSFHCNKFQAFNECHSYTPLYVCYVYKMWNEYACRVCHSESSGPVVPKYILINKIRSFFLFLFAFTSFLSLSRSLNKWREKE